MSELVEAVDQPANLVSYHLGQLRAGGVVRARRSAADGRATYYRLDVAACRDLLAGAAASLHASLGGAWAEQPRPRPARPLRVLFVCTGNSSRSQIAEAFATTLGEGRIVAASAGTHPKAVHPDAIRVGRTYGLDLSRAQAKSVDTFVGQRFDYVISLCDRAREECPSFPGATAIHWSMPDPADASLTPAERDALMRGVVAEIRDRVLFLLDAVGAPDAGIERPKEQRATRDRHSRGARNA